MNARKRTMISNPAKKIKGSGTTPSGNNTPRAIKNAVAVKPKSPSTEVRNSGSCQDDY